MKKIIAVSAVAAGLVLGGATAAHATTPAPEYVTVAWSYTGYPDLTAPQPFLASTPGANLHAFDSLASSMCGKAVQVDVYKTVDENGVSWETLKSTGSLQYSHDGGFLGYDAGVGTPYKVITPEDFPCTSTLTPSTSPTPEPSSSPSPSDTPATPEPSATATAPSYVPTMPPSSGTSVVVPADTQPAPVAGQRATSPAGELAFTGVEPWMLPAWIGSGLAVLIGGALLLRQTIKRRKA